MVGGAEGCTRGPMAESSESSVDAPGEGKRELKSSIASYSVTYTIELIP